MQSRTINLTFHGIGDHARRLDEGEEAVWLTREQFTNVLNAVVGRSDVRLTFDDGNLSDLEHALPALRERGLHATFFVCAGRLGLPEYLDAVGVRALASAGMTIGCHGMRHRPWRALGESALREELFEARRDLEGIVGHPVVDAACPFGSYNRRVLRSLRRFGYQTVYTSDGGTAAAHAWIQARTTVRSRDQDGLLERIVSRERPWYRALPRLTRRVVKQWR
jgi:peptidoglycan/xylan/chitin deacetylase (PgdA/CDA1 family)